MSERRVIGLTGGIGAGKSTAAQILASLGAVVIDCDQLGHDVIQPGGAAYQGLIDHFGPEIVADDGSINRQALAERAFRSDDTVSALNAITHPAIDAEIHRLIEASDPSAVVILDMAVLVESNLGADAYQGVLVIEAPEDVRLDRLTTTRGLSIPDAKARMGRQASDHQRRAVADWVVSNAGTQAELAGTVQRWWESEITGESGGER